jgi:hypothetical protein
MARAVAMAQAVKEAPARAILGLAERTLGCSVLPHEAGAPGAGTCCAPVTLGGSSKCCGERQCLNGAPDHLAPENEVRQMISHRRR